MPPDASPQAPDIRDIVPPAPVVDETLTVIMLASAAVLVLTVLVLIALWAVRRARGAKPPPVPGEAAAAARRDLDRLASEADQLSPGEILDRLAATIDVYLHRRHGIPAKFRTADELTREHPGHPPPVPAVAPLAEVLRSLEEQRFAAPNRARERAVALVGEARALIN